MALVLFCGRARLKVNKQRRRVCARTSMHLVDDGGIDVLLRHVLLYALRVSPSGILQELGHRHRSAWLVNSSCQCAFEAIRLLFRSVDVGNSAGQHPQQGRAYYQDTSQPDGIRKTWTKTGFPCLLQLAHGARSHKLVQRHGVTVSMAAHETKTSLPHQSPAPAVNDTVINRSTG